MVKVILLEIRKLKLKMISLQRKIDTMTYGVSAIRYDRDVVQSSPSGDMLEKAVLQKIENEEKIQVLQKQYDRMVARVNMNVFTAKQQDFVRAYYFQGLSQKECVPVLGIKISAVCRLKQRVEARISSAHIDIVK